ncbi:DUF6157 family protein [Larkinella humicola]|uniref:Uncharacterized protein n=1 Tax=Larkinella humicola TaxID=2607654 RepID=A0A5N1J997_9BACT|nr:DUF6157 family protein [Larkinella humicola]KAA9349008.1 hypothetical protein F0P93_21625 [Larkinella humicola]
MKIHTTNFTNTLIAIADDCPASRGEIPPQKGDAKSVATMQFEMLSRNPYQYTSDDVLFQVYVQRNDLTESERPAARQQFFSKGQPCFRASPLTKRYGWGVHSDENGRIALLGCDTEDYEKLSRDKNLQVVKAMKSSR